MSREKPLSWSGNAEAKREADLAYCRLRQRRPRKTKAERAANRLRKNERRKIAKQFKDSYTSYISSKRWKTKRREAVEYYGKQCALCGSTKRIQVHHLTYERFGNELMEDLQVLCRNCHEVHHDKHRPRWKRIDPVTAEYLRIAATF